MLSDKRRELLAVAGLAALYIALSSGHLHSIDGLTMFRQAESLAFAHTLPLTPPVIWGGEYHVSKFGIGLSLLYIPSLLLWSWLAPYSPKPTSAYDWSQFYADPLYTAAGAPVHIAVTVATAYLVGRLCQVVGLPRRISLWAMLIYGVGSPALVYARGDVAQPLEGLCWIAAVYCVARYFEGGHTRHLLLCIGAITYAMLTRLVDGTILAVVLIPALGVRAASAGPRSWKVDKRGLSAACGGLFLGLALTGIVNWLRFGSPLTTGYEGEGWYTPLPVGLAGALFSPGRGIIWQFPALLLAPAGFVALWRGEKRWLALVCAALATMLLVSVATWDMWWGGWNWGLRLFVPALPLIAVLVGAGLCSIPAPVRGWVAVAAVVAGLLWAIPCVFTDLFGGYAGTYDSTDASFRLQAHPLFGAWAFIKHWRAVSPIDSAAVDILWFRAGRSTGNSSILVMALLLAGSAFLLVKSWLGPAKSGGPPLA